MIILFIKLILAHFIGDFLLQPQKWVTHKETYKHKSKYLYFHVLVHFAALLIVLQFNFKYGLGFLIIVVSHYIIDLIKLKLNTKSNARLLFGLDQLAHFIIIAIVVSIYKPYALNINSLYNPKFLLLITSILGVTVVSTIIMKIVISKWYFKEDNSNLSLQNAGAFIGILERLFVFVLIISHHWEGIGFLIAAKSVLRFSDLSKAKDRKLTEYILIGTLLSFGLAVLIGIIYEYLFTLMS
ncbi:DUF3307 domain-containing protein [Algibacter pacificus]|uniref:DUF3307 domain-containing protein n=1 Tax=Algibacter pacificus TaxID=2599389 RepID=UPI0011CBD471|nr:DUF3307 domain-containing protein [Algibacter pacificus]